MTSPQWEQARLPVGMTGLGLRLAEDHGPAAYAASFLAAQDLVRKMLDTPEDQEDAALPATVLTTLTTKMAEEEPVTQPWLQGLNQNQMSAKIDLANQTLLFTHTREESGEREARG